MGYLLLGMILLMFAISPFVLVVFHLIARDRITKLERTVTETREGLGARINDLEARLRVIGGTGGAETRSEPESVTSAELAEPQPAEGIAGNLEPDITAAAVPDADLPTVALEPPPAMAAVQPPPTDDVVLPEGEEVPTPAVAPSPPLAAAPRRSGADWEEIIGGSWLNKIGSVVLVVGIALTLGYSMRWLGPLGRVALGFAMSAAMLGCGVVLEKNERYRIAARGLVGGGWAGVYFTTFAMHGLDAARIVTDPVIATGLLIGVAAAMLWHALSYRSETVTALAYFITFGTLAIVPASRFALAASVPAAASLLYIGRRFRWAHMMVAGVVFTYGAYLMRGGAPDVGPEDWAFGQTLLFFYWIIFEAFDLLSLRERRPGGIDQTLMPINAAGFLGVSLLGWSSTRPDSLWVFFVLGATCFAASAAIRAWLVGDGVAGEAEADDDTTMATALGAGGYAASLSIAAVLLVLGIERGFDGWRENVAWIVQAQLLILSGIMLRSRFLRHLGSAVLAVPVVAVLLNDLPSSRTIVVWGRDLARSTPIALLTAAVLYADRALLRRASGVRVGGLEPLYNWAATFLVAAVLATELPDLWIAPAWFVLGLTLVALGNIRGAGELYVQGCVAIAAAWIVAMLGNIPADDLVMGLPARWATALPMVAALYALAYMARLSSAQLDAARFGTHGGTAVGEPAAASVSAGIDTAAGWLDRGSSLTMSTGATVLMAWFLLFEVSGRWLTVAWGLQGVALLTAGLILHARGLRLGGLALLGICIAKLFAYDLSELDTLFQIFSFIILGTLLIAVSFAYGRYREQIRRLL